MGAAGDMLMAALSELLPDPEAFIARMNALGLPGVRFERRRAEKCGIVGTRVAVTISYDLLYRRWKKKGVSFRNKEYVVEMNGGNEK